MSGFEPASLRVFTLSVFSIYTNRGSINKTILFNITFLRNSPVTRRIYLIQGLIILSTELKYKNMKNITFNHPIGICVYENDEQNASATLSGIAQDLLSNENLILESGDILEDNQEAYEVKSITYRYCGGSLVGIDFRTVKK